MRHILTATACAAALIAGCSDSEVESEETVTVDPVVDTTMETATASEKFEGCLPGGTSVDMTPEPTAEGARIFLTSLEEELIAFNKCGSEVYWEQATNVTDENNARVAVVGGEGAKLSTQVSNAAKIFNGVELPARDRRIIDGLKRGSNFPAPDKPGAAEELATLMSEMDAAYAQGQFEYKSETIGLFPTAMNVLAESREPDDLLAIWEGWRTISPPMKDDYARMVEIINEGAQELGYADAGALWRAGYDMDADDFAAETDRLWGQVKPLYDDLHCFVRSELNAEYGDDVQPATGPINAHLLGNMWAQQWGNIYPLVAPEGAPDGVDVTALLEAEGYDAMKMVETGDAFFQSMGFDPLPDTFWERSMIVKPEGRDVQCHASAWNLDDEEDVRIKMCTEVNAEDFQTVHHELGHNIYQRAYKDQPTFFKDGANDGFHEAIGDMIALSITPDYLVEIGLLDEADVPGTDADTALLLRQAMDKVAFMPWGLLVDKWRWQVFDGTLTPATYNDGWWALREEYQGIQAPVDRPADAFDPGAKYHIPGNTPYMRYFLAHILQFQFHKAACDMAGFEGPLHRCSVYGNEEVGEKFNAMMEMGSSQPWPDALEAFTGTRQMDGSAMLEYFAPLHDYLKEENEGRTCGW